MQDSYDLGYDLEHLQNATILREDGVAGVVTAITTQAGGVSALLIRFEDGAQVVVAPRMLSAEGKGVYRLALAATHLATSKVGRGTDHNTATDRSTDRSTDRATDGPTDRKDSPVRSPVHSVEKQLVIPVVAEELQVSTEEVTRGVVRVRTHVETTEEVVDAPITAEEVQIERVPVHALVEGDPPQVREEDGIVIFPVLEEVLVVEKRLMLREEIRLSKRVTQSSAPQTVLLRREVVDIERLPAEGSTPAAES